MSDPRDAYRGRRVLVTGGLGFIGSNLCRALADLGAQVTAVDSLLPDYGGNLFNLDGYQDRVRINVADVRGHGMKHLVRGQQVLFNLAGQVSHVDSMTDPFTDLEINCTSQLWILEAVRQTNPDLKIVYAGTRQVYGKPLYLPVDEKQKAHVVISSGRPNDRVSDGASGGHSPFAAGFLAALARSGELTSSMLLAELQTHYRAAGETRLPQLGYPAGRPLGGEFVFFGR